jgi:hypothetical protein
VEVAQAGVVTLQEMVFQELLAPEVVAVVQETHLAVTAYKVTEDLAQLYLLTVASHNYLLVEQ